MRAPMNSRTTLALAACLLAAFSTPLLAQDEGAKKDKKAKKDPAAQEEGDEDEKGEKAMWKTFAQNQWGSGDEANDRARRKLEKHFAAIFPKGMKVGRSKGGGHAFVIESWEQVHQLLPISGPPKALEGEQKGDLKETGGLAGQIIALHLNVAFDQAGKLGSRDAESGEPDFADLVLAESVQRSLRGMTVMELLNLSERALSGQYGTAKDVTKKVIDVDDDGDADVSFMDLRDALQDVNSNFAVNRKPGDALIRPSEAASLTSDLDEKGEQEVEKLEEELDAEIAEAERERDRAMREAAQASDPAQAIERRQAARERFEQRKEEIYEKFEEKQGRTHPGEMKRTRRGG